MSTKEIPLGEYIFRRLHGLGINHIFGVPGDFNLNLLDHLDSVEGLSWVGTCNELNGAYAADGYARCRQLPGVIITTYGVGELSAINGIGGAYSEYVPVIHIVGTTARAAQKARLMIHHTLGEGLDHAVYRDVSRPLCAASEFLANDTDFTAQVDHVIQVCFRTKLPVYLYVPIDTPDILVDAGGLQKPLDLVITNAGREREEDSIVDKVVEALGDAERPCLLVDLLVQRFELEDDARKILQLTGMPGFVTPLGKSLVDETDDSFGGVYLGEYTTSRRVKDDIEGADLVLYLGRFPSDTNSGGWTQKLATQGTLIILHPHYISVGEQRWDSINFVPVVKKLVRRLDQQKGALRQSRWLKNESTLQPELKQSLRGNLRQRDFWHCFNAFLREDDYIIAEVGSSQFGTLDLDLRSGSNYYTQIFYSCIGFTVGSTLGTLVARREQGNKGRVILFVGDGSLQLTVQEISTMIHNGFHPTIVVINNSGYTVERVIHGPARKYNDIAPWNYQLMLQFFGAPSSSAAYVARTYEELLAILEDPKFQASESIQVLECILDKYDSPKLLTDMVDGNMARTKAALLKDDQNNNRSRKFLDGTLTESGLSLGLQST